jgi:hypothetical protein
LVVPLDELDIERVIETPALDVGMRFEDGLVKRIQNDFQQEPGALPLLQDALLQLFNACKTSTVMTQQAYNTIGGVQGSLAKRADELYRQFSPEQQAITKRILLRLTQPGEGSADTRRRAAKSELWSTDEEKKAVVEVLDRLTASRLLTASKDIEETEEQVDVSHEALIRGWLELGRWINEDRAGLRLHRRLTEAASEWKREQCSEDLLYRGSRLD